MVHIEHACPFKDSTKTPDDYESYVLYLITMINKITMIIKITLVIIMVIMEIMVINKIIIN